MTRRLRATVAYDGTDFAGWQRQTRRRTVQGTIEQALAQVTGVTTRVVGAGRTDAGVHAAGQVAHFDTVWTGPPARLQRALNAVLPPDVAVLALGEADPTFHARFDAAWRCYRYRILAAPHRHPLEARFSDHVAWPLDAATMAAEAQALVGRHDFGAFGKPPTAGGSTERRLRSASLWAEGDVLVVELVADAFLRHQVRRTVGLLVDVGRGALPAGTAAQVLGRSAGAPAPRRAPARGLVLWWIDYGGQGPA